MINCKLELELLTDAEPGTGLGTDLLDDRVPRDERGVPVLPASHLKGLLRDGIHAMSSWLTDAGPVAAAFDRLADHLLGRGGEVGGDGTLGVLQLADLRWDTRSHGRQTLEIRRTALSELGTAHRYSLRAVEAVGAGSIFTGAVWVDAEAGSSLDLLWRLGLLSIEAVGGGRTRGAGRCRIRIDGETRSPGQLLQALEQNFARGDVTSNALGNSTPPARSLQDRTTVWYRLCFTATAPVCCPEAPVVGRNLVRSGPVIPASAVQGALLTLLSRQDDALASAVFLDPAFRTWPLVPVASLGARDLDQCELGVRVDLAHRMSKLPRQRAGQQSDQEHHDFFDSAIAPYHWSQAPEGSSLKSSDGVLVRYRSGNTMLWRAQDLPRILRAHGVHSTADGTRNLFSVEALAPMVFTGLVALPREAAVSLLPLVQEGAPVTFGKARSVRGAGTLTMQEVGQGWQAPWQWSLTEPSTQGRVFVVQSPLAVPDHWAVDRAEVVLQRLVAEAGWGELVLGDPEGRGRHAGSAAAIGVRFGWNRLGHGLTVGMQRRLRARRVVLPGSVLVLREPLLDPERQLLRGLGDGREQGFGALLPHPGIASGRLPVTTPLPELGSDGAGRLALQLWRQAGRQDGPSPSQIGDLAQRLTHGPEAAQQFLDTLKERARRAFDLWQPVVSLVRENLSAGRVEILAKALRTWQDLRIVADSEESRRNQ